MLLSMLKFQTQKNLQQNILKNYLNDKTLLIVPLLFQIYFAKTGCFGTFNLLNVFLLYKLSRKEHFFDIEKVKYQN